MNRDNLLLIGLPFLITALIIFGHYRFLAGQNPQAHSRPLITTARIESLKDSELQPASPASPFPKTVVGAMHEIPTSKKQLQELLTLLASQQANTLFLRVGMTVTEDGNIVLTQAAESSEETLLRWTKKTVSDAHRAGFHTYVAIMFVENPIIKDPARFSTQLKEVITRWANMAQEFQIAFFNPGVVLGQTSFMSLPQDRLQVFVTEIERHTRELYTGRLGIGYCCSTTPVVPRGYNQILIISTAGSATDELSAKAGLDARNYNIEHIFLLELDTQRLTTLL